MVKDLKFGDAVAKPGSKAIGHWTAIKRMDGQPENLVVLLANGSKPGPTVWIIGGLHAEEVWGSIGAQKVLKDLDPSKMSGSVICLPAANPSAFWAKARCSPHDGGDAERLSPGDPRGTYSQRLANAVYEAVRKAIASGRCDATMILHGAGREWKIIDFTVFDYFDPRTKNANREAGRALDVDYAFGIPKVHLGGGLLHYQVTALGAPCNLIEGSSTDFYVRNLKNWLKHWRVLEEKPTYKDQIRINKLIIMNCKHGGIFMPKVDIYSRFTKGMVLAEIVNLEGETVEEIVAPIDGMVMTIRTYPIVLPSWEEKLLDAGRRYPGTSWEDKLIFELAGIGTKDDW